MRQYPPGKARYQLTRKNESGTEQEKLRLLSPDGTGAFFIIFPLQPMDR